MCVVGGTCGAGVRDGVGGCLEGQGKRSQVEILFNSLEKWVLLNITWNEERECNIF